MQRFVHRNLPSAARHTQHARFGAWDGRGALTLLVDHGSDGKIDATIMLENQITALYLPLVARGR